MCLLVSKLTKRCCGADPKKVVVLKGVEVIQTLENARGHLITLLELTYKRTPLHEPIVYF